MILQDLEQGFEIYMLFILQIDVNIHFSMCEINYLFNHFSQLHEYHSFDFHTFYSSHTNDNMCFHDLLTHLISISHIITFDMCNI